MVQLCFSMENACYNKSDSRHMLLDCKRTLETLEWSQAGQWRWGKNTAINLFTAAIIKMTEPLTQESYQARGTDWQVLEDRGWEVENGVFQVLWEA